MKPFLVICLIILCVCSIVAIFHTRNYRRIPRVTYVPWLPFKHRRGITIPPFGIFIRNQYKNETWMEPHEDIHWKQYQSRGLFRFYIEYFRDYKKNGYFNNSFEKEAREKGGWEESDRSDEY